MILKEFENFIGNNHIKKQLSISLLAAREMNNSLPHTLFVGHPGCGKTSLAKLIADITGTKVIQAAPESLKSVDEVKELLERVSQEGYNDKGKVVSKITPSIVFLDEIHNLPLKGQESFGIAMEYFQISTKKIKFGRKKDVTYWIPRFTLIGATTEAGNLSKPFYDKFKLIFQFELYSIDELKAIINNYLRPKGISISEDATEEIAKRARGIPRLAKRYSDRVVELATLHKLFNIGKGATDRIFDLLAIDELGLTQLDRKILIYLYEAGRPVGVDNLSVITAEPRRTLEHTVEPYLIRNGLIARTSGGRVITEKGEEYLVSKRLIEKEFTGRIISEE